MEQTIPDDLNLEQSGNDANGSAEHPEVCVAVPTNQEGGGIQFILVCFADFLLDCMDELEILPEDSF